MDEENTNLDKEQEEKYLVSYHCNVCETNFSVSKSMSIFSCPYCQSKNVGKLDDLDCSDFYSLPFVDTLADAKKKYQSMVRFNPILPSIFRSKKTIHSMKKVYLPCMLYDIKVDGKISFLGADPIKNVKAVPTQIFESGFHTSFQYDNVLACEYAQVTDSMLTSINDFNYSVLSPFQEKKLKDTYIIHMNDKVEEEKQNILERVMKHSVNIVRENVNHAKKKLKDNQLKLDIQSAKKVLMPVYLLRVHYQNNDYLFLMNGHTGKANIDLVSSKKSILLFSIIVFIILFVLLVLLTFLF